MASLQIDSALIKRASHVLNAVDNGFRLKILKAIHINGSLTVTELCIQLHQDQASTSKHLRTLREASFVSTNRKGKYIYYTINYSSLIKMTGLISELLKQPVMVTFEKPVSLFLLEYKTYVLDIIEVLKPIPQIRTYEGMQDWLKSFSQKLKAYNLAIGKKKAELLRRAKKEGNPDLELLKEALEKSKQEGIKAYIKQYNS